MIMRFLRPAFIMMMLCSFLLGGGYPLVMTAIAVPFNSSATLHGSVDPAMIGQDFSTDDSLFQGRLSAVDYDPSQSGGSNLDIVDETFQSCLDERKKIIAARENISPDDIPADAITTSASGLDPHISLDYAELQIPRVAKKNSMSASDLSDLVHSHIDHVSSLFSGIDQVNVVTLNRDLIGRR